MPMLPDGTVYYATIDYNYAPNKLRVFLDTCDFNRRLVLIVDSLELGRLLDLELGEGAFVGFTGATGDAWERQDILYWEFCPKPSDFISAIEDFEEGSSSDEIKIYPNPFNEILNIEFTLDRTENVIIKAYNLLGEEIGNSNFGWLEAGSHSVELNGRAFGKGAIILQINFGDRLAARRLLMSE